MALLSDGGEMVGFFPFEIKGKGIGKPLGGPLSDLQGVIAAPGTAWDAIDLIRRCGLKVLDFDHMLASQAPFRPFHTSVELSPYTKGG